MEGDDQQDPLVDGVRALLDGHVVLDRDLNAQGHYPSVSVLDSVSRLMPAVCSPEHRQKVQRLRRLLAAYAGSQDLIRVGAYQKGLDPVLDQAHRRHASIDQLSAAAGRGEGTAGSHHSCAAGIARLGTAMAFRFSLQSLLRLRRSYERRERLRLEVLTRQLVQVRQQLEAVHQDKLTARRRWAQQLRKGMFGAEMQFEAGPCRPHVRDANTHWRRG